MIASPPATTTQRALLRLIAVAVLSLVCALWLAAPVRAADAAAFDAAFTDFQRAAGGDAGAIDSAASRFDALSGAEPADPVLQAYSGAAAAMRARTTLLPWRKMSYAEDGLARIDKALAMLVPAHDAPLHRATPASLEARFVAASAFLAMPAMFNRHARGARLLDQVLTSPTFTSAPLAFRGSVWLCAGIEAAADKRPDDARRWLQQVLSSGAPQGALAQARLNELAS
jgi:hypothetical protein